MASEDDGPSSGPVDFSPRTVTIDLVDALSQQYRTWGKWGPDDEYGAANHLTPEVVLGATRCVRTGRSFNLSLPYDRNGPQTGRNGRVNPQHLMLRDGADILANPDSADGFDYTDDVIYLPTQSGTQWDAFAHIFNRRETYNGAGPETVTSAGGASRNSVTPLGDRPAGRGVLLDVARWAGRASLDPGETIQAKHLRACAESQGVELRRGDFVIVRTGQLAALLENGEWGAFSGGPAPGLGVSAAEVLCEAEVTAIATDTWGIEAIPYETASLRAPLHAILLVNAGIWIGEIWYLEDLAAHCAEQCAWDFLLVAPPLNLTGAVGSPVAPIALT